MSVHKDLRISQIQNSENGKHVVEAIPTHSVLMSTPMNYTVCLLVFLPSLMWQMIYSKHRTLAKNPRNTSVKQVLLGFMNLSNEINFAAGEVTKKVTSSQNKISQIKAERNIFGQRLGLWQLLTACPSRLTTQHNTTP